MSSPLCVLHRPDDAYPSKDMKMSKNSFQKSNYGVCISTLYFEVLSSNNFGVHISTFYLKIFESCIHNKYCGYFSKIKIFLKSC